METNDTGIEISLQDIFHLLLKRWWIILVSAVVCAAITFIYNKNFVVPLYSSEVTFYIDPLNNEDQVSLSLEYTSLNYAKQLLDTYIQIFNTNTFRTKLSEAYTENTGKPYSASLSISGITDTVLFKIRVTTTSSEDSYEIAQLLEKIAPEMIEEIMGADKIRVTDNAVKRTSPINNNTSRNTLLGAVIGAILAVGIFLLIEIFDTRVKSEEDLKNHYDIPILGGIVDFDKSYKDKKYY